ncbi:MAG TPA: DUF1080 domain-containing protein [Verrucomicrobiales bacterium]|nr:DUF1080 domain-containing protein [Verrucomicrobiales bacterium]
MQIIEPPADSGDKPKSPKVTAGQKPVTKGVVTRQRFCLSSVVTMKTLLHSLVVAALAATSLQADHHGFKPLFDGSSLGKWDGDPMFWAVKDGVIVGETTTEKQPADKKNTFLIYRGGSFDDFELRFKYKVEGFNAGIQYRSVDKGGFHVDGLQADFEAQWHDNGKTDKFSGMFFEENGRMFMGQRGDVVVVTANPAEPKKSNNRKIATVGDPAELEKVIKRDDWNEYTVIARGNVFIHMINGRVMSIGIDEDEINSRKSGILAFQLHSGRPMKIQMKDIEIREMK